MSIHRIVYNSWILAKLENIAPQPHSPGMEWEVISYTL